MPLQDLTPQLRTRLSHMERAVGWFIFVATFLLLLGFGYYVYQSGKDRGWFVLKTYYFTYAKSGAGLHEGDPVNLVGFKVGKITKIRRMDVRYDGSQDNVYIEFEVLEDNWGWLWTQGSVARFDDSGFLGNRQLNLTRGSNGYSAYIPYTVKEVPLDEVKSLPNLDKIRLGEEIYDGTNLAMKAWVSLVTNLDKIQELKLTNVWVIDRSHTNKTLTAVWNSAEHHYEKFTGSNIYFLPPDEPPSLSDRIGIMVAQVQAALPGVLQLTNQIANTLSNTMQLTSNLNAVAQDARITVTNLNVITTQLRNPEGSLGEWLIPTNINQKLDLTLGNANVTLTDVDTNLASLNLTLNNLANITSNLNDQVQANSNMLSSISQTVVHSDEFIQGLKRFWLFRHTFATKTTNAPPVAPPPRNPRR